MNETHFTHWPGRRERKDFRSQVDTLLLKLYIHLISIDATVLGLLAVLCDIRPSSRNSLWAITLGVSLLYLALVAGMVYMFRYYWQQLKDYEEFRTKWSIKESKNGKQSKTKGKPCFLICVLFCPIGLALGLLFLLLYMLMPLWS